MTSPEYHHAYYLAHKEKAKSRTKAWYRANKEKAQAYHKKRAVEKGEELLAKKREYYVKNREIIRAKQNASYIPGSGYAKVMAWRKANPEKYKALYTRGMNRRRALKLATRVEPVDYEAIKTRNGMVCGICTLPIEGKFEYDHIIPLSKGGPHTTDNHQLAHPSCNRKKAAKLLGATTF